MLGILQDRGFESHRVTTIVPVRIQWLEKDGATIFFHSMKTHRKLRESREEKNNFFLVAVSPHAFPLSKHANNHSSALVFI